MASVAVASHGSEWINLTTSGATVEHNGALFVQGGMGAGTGNFDPFLTLQSNTDSEHAYNTTSASGEPDAFFGGGRTHPILASAIPAEDGTGALSREITLDANDQGADDYMSINVLKVFLDDQNDLTGYNDATSSFSSDTGSPATLIYDLDAGGDTTVLMRSQTLSPGSGVSDITVLIPDSAFPAECYYGSSSCGVWFYLYTAMGDPLLDDGGEVSGTQDWNVTAGFEEWRTELAPVVEVTKTAVTTVTRNYGWTVDKKVKVDSTCEDSASVDLFTGETQTAEWCIDITRDSGTLSSPAVAGTITILNPTGSEVIADNIPAKITSVSDAISNFGDVAVNCGVTFPYTLDAGQTLECTYSTTLPDATNRTNTATVVVEDSSVEFEAAAIVDFAAATLTEVDATATLTDTEGPLSQSFSGSGSTSYSADYTCDADEGANDNTATITGDDTGAWDSDTATLTLTCTIRPAPSVDIEKATNGQDADAPTGPSIIDGDPVSWTYVVTNAGNVALTNVTVSDDQGLAVSCPQSILAVGESFTCSASGTATLGQYANLGSVTATAPDQSTVSDSDPSHYLGVAAPVPAIDIEKATNGQDADAPTGPQITVGGAVNWTYVVTNSGAVDLVNVAVTDDQGLAVSCPQSILAVGESFTCSASGTATLGQYANLGSVSATAPDQSTVSDTDPSHYLGVPAPVPAIDIEKATNGQDADAPTGPQITVGGAVNWTYVVTNSGAVDLVNVAVTDDQGVTVSCPGNALAVGESMTCTASGTATLGQYANLGSVSAHATGESTVSDSDPSHYLGVSVPPPPPSDFTVRVVKQVTTSDGGVAPAAATEFEFELDCFGVDRTFALADGESYSVNLTGSTRCSLTETNDQGASSTAGEFSDLLIEGRRTFTVVNNYAGEPAVLGSRISKTLVSRDPANVGETVVFDVTIGFDGARLADAELVDIYENAYLDFQSARVGGFTLSCEEQAGAPNLGHNTVACDLGDVFAETTIQVSFTALKATTPDRTLNEANAYYDDPAGRVRIGPAFDDVEVVEVLALPPLGDGPIILDTNSAPAAVVLALATLAILLTLGGRFLVRDAQPRLS